MVLGGFPLINKIKNSISCSKTLKNLFEKLEGPSYERSCWRHLLGFRKQGQWEENEHSLEPWSLWSSWLLVFNGILCCWKSSSHSWMKLYLDRLTNSLFRETRGKNQYGKGESHGEGWTQSHEDCQLSSFWHKRLCTVIKMWRFSSYFYHKEGIALKMHLNVFSKSVNGHHCPKTRTDWLVHHWETTS